MHGKIVDGKLVCVSCVVLDDGDWRPLTDFWPDRDPTEIETLTGPVITVTPVAVTRVWSLTLLPDSVIQRLVSQAVEGHLAASVTVRGYKSVESAVSYRDDPNPIWAAQARAVLEWRSACYTACYAALAAVQAGARPPLTPDEMVAALPPLVWPD